MNISFYTPLKPVDHSRPSGDQVTAAGIADYLTQKGHQVSAVSRLRCRWIFWKPWRWPLVLYARRTVVRQLTGGGTDLWLTYHSYYKAPDVLGPYVAQCLGIPYVIFQGIYSTKRKRRLKSLAGFYLNRNALAAARHVFANKGTDLLNLRRLLPADRVSFVAPGIHPADFCFDAAAREGLRRHWKIAGQGVVFSAAMFRPDVKTEGLIWVIKACGELCRRGRDLKLVVAGDGKQKDKLMKLAGEFLPGRAVFVGRVPREAMYRFYSAADIFVFPGINESLGLVYLEAQSCGLPVVAFKNAGVPEAVADEKTGLLTPLYEFEPFVQAIERLLDDHELRRQMGRAARAYIRDCHDLNKNYQKMESMLQKIAHSDAQPQQV